MVPGKLLRTVALYLGTCNIGELLTVTWGISADDSREVDERPTGSVNTTGLAEEEEAVMVYLTPAVVNEPADVTAPGMVCLNWDGIDIISWVIVRKWVSSSWQVGHEPLLLPDDCCRSRVLFTASSTSSSHVRSMVTSADGSKTPEEWKW